MVIDYTPFELKELPVKKCCLNCQHARDKKWDHHLQRTVVYCGLVKGNGSEKRAVNTCKKHVYITNLYPVTYKARLLNVYHSSARYEFLRIIDPSSERYFRQAVTIPFEYHERKAIVLEIGSHKEKLLAVTPTWMYMKLFEGKEGDLRDCVTIEQYKLNFQMKNSTPGLESHFKKLGQKQQMEELS